MVRMASTSLGVVAALVSGMLPSTALAQEDLVCPPEGFASLPNFDIDSYTSVELFTLRGTPSFFVPVQGFYCVRTIYSPRTRQENFQFCRVLPSLCLEAYEGQQFYNIINEARINSVEGPELTNRLIAITNDPNGSADIFQGIPIPFPQTTTVGDFFVVAAGTFEDLLNPDLEVSELVLPKSNVYEWSIQVGGAPVVRGGNGCLPRITVLNPVGIFYLSRHPAPPPGTRARIDEITAFLGLSTAELVDVALDGCEFGEVPEFAPLGAGFFDGILGVEP